MPVNYGGTGVLPSLGSLQSTTLELQSGEVYLIPSGRWECKPGKYTSIQEYDPVSLFWRTIGAGGAAAPLERIVSDGANYRLANQTGCPVGAEVTAAGTGYTSTPVCTASAGSSIWRVVLGPYVSTVTVNNGGTNYTYPPQVTFAPPPTGGVPATGYSTISAGAVTSVTITDQGAGYNGGVPAVTFTPDPREGVNGVTQGSNAAATATLAGAGTVAAVICIDHGIGGQTAVPTLTISGGGGASGTATAIMCWSITALTVSTTTGGSGYANPVIISGYDTPLGGAVRTNPMVEQSLVKTRQAFIVGALSGTALTASTGVVIKDGGVYTASPTMYAYGFIQGAGAVGAVLGATMGGQLDTSVIFPT